MAESLAIKKAREEQAKRDSANKKAGHDKAKDASGRQANVERTYGSDSQRAKEQRELETSRGYDVSNTGVNVKEEDLARRDTVDFDEESYRQDLINQRNALIDRQLAMREGRLKSAYESGKSDIEGERVGVQSAYEGQYEDIQQSAFQAQEQQRALGSQRGLTFSGLQSAREMGIAREEMSLEQKARQSRDDKLADIDRRISQLTGAYESDLEMARQDASLAREQASSDAFVMAGDRAFQTEQLNAQYAWQREALKSEQDFAIQMGETQFARDIEKMNLSNQQQIDMFNLNKEFSKEMAQLDFDQKLALSDLSYQQQKNILGMSHENQKEILGLQQNLQKEIASMEIASREKLFKLDAQNRKELFAMEQESQEKFFYMDTARQMKLLTKKDQLSQAEWEKQVSYQSSVSRKEFTNDLILSNPNFSFAPEFSNSIFKAEDDFQQVELLSMYLNNNNVDLNVQQMLYAPVERYYDDMAGRLGLDSAPSFSEGGWDALTNYIDRMYGEDNNIMKNFNTIQTMPGGGGSQSMPGQN